MGTNECTKLYSKNNNCVPHTVLPEATTCSPERGRKKPEYSRICRNDIYHGQNDRPGNSGASGCFPKLSFTDVSCPQRRRLESTNIQFESAQCIHQNRSVQTDKCVSYPGFSTTAGLAMQNRPFSGIFSCSCGSQPQKISASNLSQRITGNDLFTFWSEHSAQDLCCANKLDSPNTQATRCEDNCVSRRFLDRSPRREPASESCQNFARNSGDIRLADQLQKVGHHTVEKPSLSRNPLGSMGESQAPSRRQNSWPCGENRSFAVEGAHNSQGAPKPRRSPQFCLLHSSERKTQFSRASEPFEQNIEVGSQEITFLTSPSHRKPDMVAPKLSTPVGPTHATSSAFPHNRCIGHRLGSSPGQSLTLGSLVRSRERSSLQPKGNDSNPKSFGRSLSAPETQDGFNSERQQVGSCIPTSRGRYQISSSPGLNLQGFPDHRATSNSHERFLHTGYIQRPRRSSIEIADDSRVASVCKMHEQNILEMGSATNRPICIQPGSCSVELRVFRPERRPSPVLRCVFPNVELQSCVGVSSTFSDSQGFRLSQSSTGNVLSRSSTVGEGFLATRHQIACPSSPIHNTSPRRSADRQDNRATTTECTRNDSRSVEMWGWSGMLKSWNSSQLELLEKSWRPSTRKVYGVAWKRWLAWCETHQVNPSSPIASDLARYLSDLHLVNKLSYSSILLHKSVVSNLCNPDSSGQLSSNTLVKHVLKSIALQKLIPRVKPPVWNIDDLASFLESKRVDENNSFQVQRHTAALLLLCSGRRIHDLTLLRVDSNNYCSQDNVLVFWPVFGSKTDSVDNRQSGWRLFSNKANKNLDPVHWAKCTISLLENRRNAANCNNLFINIRGKPKPASKTLIAGWIKSQLVEAGIKATPGSVRSAVASKNWVDNYPLEEILARGNWRSQNTFSKYYKREVKPSGNRVSVTALFNPVD